MAQTHPASLQWKITTNDNGNIGVYGAPTPTNTNGGAFSLDFIPDLTWAGAIYIMGRGPGLSTSDPTGFLVVPYRKVYFNGAPADWSMVVPDGTTATAVTARSLIVVPAYGLEIGVQIVCTTGFGLLRATAVGGPSIP